MGVVRAFPAERSVEPLVSKKEVARCFGVSVKTVERWSREWGLPVAERSPGGWPRYYLSEVRAWAAARNAQETPPGRRQAR